MPTLKNLHNAHLISCCAYNSEAPCHCCSYLWGEILQDELLSQLSIRQTILSWHLLPL